LSQIAHQGYYCLEFNTCWEVYRFKWTENKINTRKKWFKFILPVLNIIIKWHDNLLGTFSKRNKLIFNFIILIVKLNIKIILILYFLKIQLSSFPELF
jgi:hypothetical protein